MKSDNFEKKFLDTCNDKFLTQHVTFPTHKSGNTLDLLLSTEDELIGDVTDCGPLGGADHTKVLAEIILPLENNESTESIGSSPAHVVAADNLLRWRSAAWSQ